jgi:hypothetical protein
MGGRQVLWEGKPTCAFGFLVAEVPKDVYELFTTVGTGGLSSLLLKATKPLPPRHDAGTWVEVAESSQSVPQT